MDICWNHLFHVIEYMILPITVSTFTYCACMTLHPQVAKQINLPDDTKVKYTVYDTCESLLEICSSRKYQYPHHGGNFMQVSLPPRNFNF